MRKLFCLIFLFLVIHAGVPAQENCEDKKHPLPVFSDSLQKVFDANLSSSYSKFQNDSTNDEYIIWYGRRTAYLGNYKEAINIYTRGIKLFPKDARFLRHRAHRYITLRCFDKAIADLEKAVELIRGKTDEVEADGLPNALNIPTTTLHSNIWYHLGLAYFLKGSYEKALNAYELGMLVADNNDMHVALLNWLNIVLRKLGKTAEAEMRIRNITSDLMIIENKDYLDILLLYKYPDRLGKIHKMSERQAASMIDDIASNATFGFGVGYYYLLKEEKDIARRIFEKITAGKQWSSFGFIAAEVELNRMK